MQQAAANNTISSSTFFLYRTSRQKEQKEGEQTGEATTVVPGIRITASRTLWTTTNKLEAEPAAKGRDNEGQMRRSHLCFFGLIATCDVPGTHLPNAKTAAVFQPHPDGTTKKQISYFGDPHTGELY